MLDRLAGIAFDWNAYLAEVSGGLISATDMPDATKLFQYLALWNNQTKNGKAGMPTTKPCAYVQPVFGKATNLGLGATLYQDFKWRIHIVDFQVDGFNEAGGAAGTNIRIGGTTQNLEIYKWRDLVKVALNGYWPLHCGCLTDSEEYPDDEHEDLIHYVIDFVAAFTDLKGSPMDPDQTAIIKVDPPEPAGEWGLVENITITN